MDHIQACLLEFLLFFIMQDNKEEPTLCQNCTEQEQLDQISNVIDFYKNNPNNLIQICMRSTDIRLFTP